MQKALKQEKLQKRQELLELKERELMERQRALEGDQAASHSNQDLKLEKTLPMLPEAAPEMAKEDLAQERALKKIDEKKQKEFELLERQEHRRQKLEERERKREERKLQLEEEAARRKIEQEEKLKLREEELRKTQEQRLARAEEDRQRRLLADQAKQKEMEERQAKMEERRKKLEEQARVRAEQLEQEREQRQIQAQLQQQVREQEFKFKQESDRIRREFLAGVEELYQEGIQLFKKGALTEAHQRFLDVEDLEPNYKETAKFQRKIKPLLKQTENFEKSDFPLRSTAPASPSPVSFSNDESNNSSETESSLSREKRIQQFMDELEMTNK